MAMITSQSLVHFMLLPGRRNVLGVPKSNGLEIISIRMLFPQLNRILGVNPLHSPKRCELWPNGCKIYEIRKSALVTFPLMIFKRKNAGLRLKSSRMLKLYPSKMSCLNTQQYVIIYLSHWLQWRL